MSQFDKIKNKLCMKVCLKSKKSSDYEFVSYDKPAQSIAAKPIKTSLHSKKITHENPQFQSTQLEQSTSNTFYTTVLNETTDQQIKISSTFIPNIQPFQLEDAEPSLSLIDEDDEDKETSRAFSNVYYTSPILSRSVSITSSSSESLSFSSDMFSEPTGITANSFECNSEQFKSVNGSYFDSVKSSENSLHVCVLAYKAQFEGDLSVNFAERVKILHSVNNEYALVKNISNNNCGYVPRKCLSPLNEFLAEIARNCHNL